MKKKNNEKKIKRSKRKAPSRRIKLSDRYENQVIPLEEWVENIVNSVGESAIYSTEIKW